MAPGTPVSVNIVGGAFVYQGTASVPAVSNGKSGKFNVKAALSNQVLLIPLTNP
jgi:hypothetical protein